MASPRGKQKARLERPTKSRAGERTRGGGLVTKRGIPRKALSQRILDVEKMYLCRVPEARIIEELAAEYRVDEDTIRKDLDRIRVDLIASFPASGNVEEVRAELRVMVLQLHRLCITEGDRAEAGRNLDRLARLYGAYAPDRLEHGGMVQHLTLTDAELTDEVKALLPLLTAEERAQVLPPGTSIDVEAVEVPAVPVEPAEGT